MHCRKLHGNAQHAFAFDDNVMMSLASPDDDCDGGHPYTEVDLIERELAPATKIIDIGNKR